MNTTLMLKLDKELRDNAKKTAEALGVPLTTVVHALLKQFVRERKITVSLDTAPTKTKLRLFESISSELDRELKRTKHYNDADKLIADLGLL